MRFKFETAQELWNRGIDYERVEDDDMVANEYARAGWVKSRRVPDFDLRACKAKNIAKEKALGPVVLSRID
jgi:hypothetical protein